MSTIVTVPNEVLVTPAKTITKIDRKILSVVEDMKQTLRDTRNPRGVGLAATQIGLSLRLFITRPTEKAPIRVFFNPQIVSKSEELGELERPPEEGKPSLKKEKKLEGCLSIPNVWGYLKRHTKVTLSYMDIAGVARQEEFSGFMATIVQHETDHTNGLLFTTRVLEQKEKLYHIVANDKGEEELEEIRI